MNISRCSTIESDMVSNISEEFEYASIIIDLGGRELPVLEDFESTSGCRGERRADVGGFEDVSGSWSSVSDLLVIDEEDPAVENLTGSGIVNDGEVSIDTTHEYGITSTSAITVTGGELVKRQDRTSVSRVNITRVGSSKHFGVYESFDVTNSSPSGRSQLHSIILASIPGR